MVEASDILNSVCSATTVCHQTNHDMSYMFSGSKKASSHLKYPKKQANFLKSQLVFRTLWWMWKLSYFESQHSSYR